MFCIVNTCFIWRLISILRFAVFILNFIPNPIRRISLTPEFTTQLHRESCLDSVLIKTFSVFFYWSCQSLQMTRLRFALKPLVKYFKNLPPSPATDRHLWQFLFWWRRIFAVKKKYIGDGENIKAYFCFWWTCLKLSPNVNTLLAIRI